MRNGKIQTIDTNTHYHMVVIKGSFSKGNQSHLRKLKRLRNELNVILRANPPETHV